MEIKNCKNHEKQNPNFFCFDDKKFLCDACFKEHKIHNIEIISQVKKNEKFINMHSEINLLQIL